MTIHVPDQIIYVNQGEFRVSHEPQVVFSTVLGSCVAVCLWDKERKFGGMNHFLLPSGPDSAGDATRYGVHAMELLINSMLRQGTRRMDLQAKLFGGARMSATLRDIGSSNAAFAQEFLMTEDIPCIAQSLGGTNARRVLFRPSTGHVRQLIVAPDDVVQAKPVQSSPRNSDPILF